MDRAVKPNETFAEWLKRLDKPDTWYWRSWYEQDKQSRHLMKKDEEKEYLERQGWTRSRPRRRINRVRRWFTRWA